MSDLVGNPEDRFSDIAAHISVNFLELEYVMLLAKFHDHRTSGSVGEDH